ncbi:hypothetical protein L2E82_18928 [Cichorium intybus]|uniref:Uncharacterized protein n=1 Tax=Cichorium intybus TaxID=13427 RepID=A0ACB9FAJ7_CICIN|nr:hypothetical protein L2E82_18928 [Cichorium intybus]
MSFPDTPPPSPSRDALWSLKPEFPEKSQPPAVVEDAIELPSPTDSTRFIRSSKQQFPAGGKTASENLVYKFFKPPSHTAVRLPVYSIKPLLDENSNSDWEETDRRGASITNFVHANKSVYDSIDPYGVDEFFIPQPQQSALRRQPEQSSDLLPGENGNDEWDETDHLGASLSGFVHTNNSVYHAVDPYQAESSVLLPQHSDVRRRPMEKSSNPLPDVNDKSAWDETKQLRTGHPLI